MKKALYILLVCLCTVACDKGNETGDESIFVHYFIGYYNGGDYVLAEIKERETEATVGIGIGLDNVINYQTPEWSNSVNTEEFVRIAARNGDTGFDGNLWSFIYLSRVVFADNFQSIHLTSDRDWDEEHPAGTLLDDIVLWEAITYSDFIRNGYTGGNPDESPFVYYQESLAAIEPAWMEMIKLDQTIGKGHSPNLLFAKSPTLDKEHTLTVTLTTTEGKTYRPTITLRPEAYVP